MTDRPTRGTAEALVHTGRAPRRFPAPVTFFRSVTSVTRATRRALVLTAVTAVAGIALAPAASAHEGTDPEIAAVLDSVTPAMPGVDLTVETTGLGSQFVLANPTPTEVTVLSSAGDPLFRIGPDGVLGNLRSPEWYSSKVPSGSVTVPERATVGGTPVWARVADEPAWGWFDHRLHQATLSPEQKAETDPLEPFGSWSVPLSYGDALGSVDGHFEYRPPVGTFTPELSETTPAPGITLAALPGNPTPAVSIDNAGPSEVVVLGDQDEPYLRITPQGSEANQLSPTWLATQDGAQPPGDAAAPPAWTPVSTNGRYSFPLERAGPDGDLAELYAATGPEVVREWTLSLLVDGDRVDVDGTTTLTPVEGRGGFWTVWTVGGAIVLGLVVAGAAVWFVRRRRSEPPSGGQHAHRREPVGSVR
jgi:hypothetical protein